MFAQVKTIIQLLKLIQQIYLFLEDKITEAQLTQKIQEIKQSITQATSGPIADRLQGGRNFENTINSNSNNQNDSPPSAVSHTKRDTSAD